MFLRVELSILKPSLTIQVIKHILYIICVLNIMKLQLMLVSYPRQQSKNQRFMFRLSAQTWDCFLLHNIQTGSGKSPASYSILAGSSLLGVNRPKREGKKSLLSSAEDNNDCSQSSLLPHTQEQLSKDGNSLIDIDLSCLMYSVQWA